MKALYRQAPPPPPPPPPPRFPPRGSPRPAALAPAAAAAASSAAAAVAPPPYEPGSAAEPGRPLRLAGRGGGAGVGTGAAAAARCCRCGSRPSACARFPRAGREALRCKALRCCSAPGASHRSSSCACGCSSPAPPLRLPAAPAAAAGAAAAGAAAAGAAATTPSAAAPLGAVALQAAVHCGSFREYMWAPGRSMGALNSLQFPTPKLAAGAGVKKRARGWRAA